MNPQSKEPTFKLLGSKFTADPGTLTALNNIQVSSSVVPSSLFQRFTYSLKCFQSRSRAAIFSLLAINSPVVSITCVINHSSKMLHWPKSITCVTAQKKTKSAL